VNEKVARDCRSYQVMSKLPGIAAVQELLCNAEVTRNCRSYQGMPKLPGTAEFTE
jgi:hypothetical protein